LYAQGVIESAGGERQKRTTGTCQELQGMYEGRRTTNKEKKTKAPWGVVGEMSIGMESMGEDYKPSSQRTRRAPKPPANRWPFGM